MPFSIDHIILNFKVGSSKHFDHSFVACTETDSEVVTRARSNFAISAVRTSPTTRVTIFALYDFISRAVG